MCFADSHIRVVGAGLLPVALRLPAAVAVDELRQVGRLLGVARDELVLYELFGCRPLCTHIIHIGRKEVSHQ